MDIFCQIEERFSDQIIYRTKSFFLVHDGYPLTEGHLLIIPKQHINTFWELDRLKKSEFLKLRDKVENFMIRKYKRPVFFEHGGIIQTVPHAHFHILPTNKSIISGLLKVTRIINKPRKNYLYYNEEGKDYFLYPRRKLRPGFLHSEFAMELGRPVQGPDRAKDLEKWLLEVKKKWKNAS